MHAINRITSIVNHKSINLSNSDSSCACVHGLGASSNHASREAPRQHLAVFDVVAAGAAQIQRSTRFGGDPGLAAACKVSARGATRVQGRRGGRRCRGWNAHTRFEPDDECDEATLATGRPWGQQRHGMLSMDDEGASEVLQKRSALLLQKAGR
uniref:Uncharacterized protein n=1 Tax=Zea mays TaxID=4577 RepID=C4J131_MAIZE|nr:unknown [Zea mays]|eukprot:XP_020402094.1 uncharacterized protein LOC100501102 [Zea mays]